MKSRVLDLLGVPAYHPQGFSRVGRQTRLFEGGGAEIYSSDVPVAAPPRRVDPNFPVNHDWTKGPITVGDIVYTPVFPSPSGGEGSTDSWWTGGPEIYASVRGSTDSGVKYLRYDTSGGIVGEGTYGANRSRGFFGDMFSHAASAVKDTAPIWMAALGANYLLPTLAGGEAALGSAAAGSGASTVGITGAEAAAMGAFDAAAGAGAASSAALPAAAVDYSLASAPAASSGFTSPLASTAGPAGATNYSLATQPVYGGGNGLALGTSPVVGTGAGLSLAAGASPALGAPSSFVNALTTPAAMAATTGATPGAATTAATGAATTAATGAANAATEASPFAFLGPAAATLLGSYLSGESAEKAARVSAEAADRATALQQRIYEESVARQQPFLAGGTEDYNRLRAVTSGGPEAAQNFLTMDPGYKFRLSEGMKALDRQAAARGGLISGNALKATQRYGQDLASQEFGNAYNRLAGLANVGPSAAGVMNTLGQNYASNVGNITMGQGNTAANALLARGSSYQRGLGDIASLYGRMYGPQQPTYMLPYAPPGGP